ncbi:hypothetical protein MH1LPH_00520 [Lactiplantibacillus brownii]
MTATAAPNDNTIKFDKVTFGYHQSEPILDQVSFEVPDGQWLGIIGATGAGKSSLINLLTRRFDQYTGKITLGGVDIKTMSLKAVHTKIAVALQDSLLFSGTVRSNLAYGAPKAPTTVLAQAAKTAVAADFIDQLPATYDAPVEQAGKNFSGGQRQRLNISRAIVPDSDILIMDDATSAVDQTTNAEIKAHLMQARSKRTTIIISQRVTNVMACDQIMVLTAGKVSAVGTHAELLKRSEFYRQLVKTQLGGGRYGHA